MIILAVFGIWLVVVGIALVVDARRGILQRIIDLGKNKAFSTILVKATAEKTHYVMTHEIGDTRDEIVTPTIRVPKTHGTGKHRHV